MSGRTAPSSSHAPLDRCRYRAFISYSHADEAWAKWLHKALETWRVPSRLVGTRTAAGVIPRRLAPVFRDRDELASAADLGERVNAALADSASLIVICSPHSAASRWVNEEVLAFKRLGQGERIFCLIVGGEPNAADSAGREVDECFCPALRFALDADGHSSAQRAEPIAADVREGKDGKRQAKLKLIAGMLGVGFDALRQRAQQRRMRRMAAITVLALVAMMVTSALAITAVIARQQADTARQAAERRQKQAENLVGFMLGDLNDKLAQVGRLDIMSAVDDQAMRYFESLPTTDVTDEALEQRAKALEKIGNVRQEQGQMPAANQAYQASLRLARTLALARPADVARQLAFARAWSYVGMTHWYQGQLEQALQGFRSAQKILERTQPTAQTRLQLLFEMATVDNNLGHILESRGKLDEAATQYLKVLHLSGELVAAQPDKTEWQVALGSAHNNLGKLALMRGELLTSITEYLADEGIQSELAARHPEDNNQQENVLLVRAILGRTLALAGDVESALRYLRQAAAIAARRHQLDPSNTSIREDIALVATQLGRQLRLRGDLPAARAQSQRAVALLRALTGQDPDNSGWQRGLAEALLEQAAQSRAGGRMKAALQQAHSAENLLTPLFERQPDDHRILLATMTGKLLLAGLTEREHPKRANQQRKKLLAILQARASNDPRLLALQVDALLALHRQSEARPMLQRLWRSGYRDPALLATLRHAGIDYPVNHAFRQRLHSAARTAALRKPEASLSTPVAGADADQPRTTSGEHHAQ